MQIWVCFIYFVIIGCVTTSLVIMLLKGKSGIHNTLYALCQLSVILWCMSQVMLGISNTLSEQWMSYLVGNIGICTMGSLWFLFVKSYNHQDDTFCKGWFLLFLFPIFFYICFLTNGYHHLYYKIFAYKEVVRGILFYINVIYTYACSLIGCFLLLRRTSLSDAVNVFTAKAMIVAAAVVPIIMNAIQLIGLNKADYDITALGFGISTILVLCATIRFKFMDVNMKAFDSIIYHLTDGVMLFEDEEAVYDNPAFWKLLQLERPKQKIEEFTFETWEQYKRENLIEIRSMVESDTKEAHSKTQTDHIYQLRENPKQYLAIEELRHDEKHRILVLNDVSEYFALLQASNELAISKQQFALSKERNRIAQQVHDTTGHTLVMVQSLLKLSRVEQDNAEKYLLQAQTLVKDGLRELREAINAMRKEESAQLVTQAVSQLTSQVHEFEITVTLQGEDSEKYAYLTTVVYDTLRETITNCLKYANATKMDVVVRFLESKLELLIADDGEGCDDMKDNNGLLGIRERIAEKEGTVRFISSKGEGFMTKVMLPVK